MIGGMKYRWPAPSVAVFVGAVLLSYALAGCGDDEASGADTSGPRITGPGLGLGEWSDDGAGDRRVLRVADSEAASDASADRSVTALVEICAPKNQAQSAAAADWQLVLDHGDPAPASGDPSPTDEGSPPLSPSGRVAPGDCAFANVDFAVPAGSLTVGMLFHPATGGDVRWSWEPADTVTS
jgi:hypothetical protein